MDVERLAEPVNGPTAQWLAAQAQTLNVAITGSLITKEGDHYYNRMLWAEPGAALRHYDKRHLSAWPMSIIASHPAASPSPCSGAASASARWSATTCAFPCTAAGGPSSSTTAAVRGELAGRSPQGLAGAAEGARHRESCFRGRRESHRADGNDIAYSGDSVVHDFMGDPLAELGEESASGHVELDARP